MSGGTERDGANRKRTLQGTLFKDKRIPGLNASSWQAVTDDAAFTEEDSQDLKDPVAVPVKNDPVLEFTVEHGKEVLRLLSELYTVPEDAPAHPDYAGEVARGNLLEFLREENADQESTASSPSISRRNEVKRKIQRLLGLPGANEMFFPILKAEGGCFKAALPLLKATAEFQELSDLVKARQVKLYRADRSAYGALQASTGTAIGTLTGAVAAAQSTLDVKMNNVPAQTRGWLIAQECLRYKDELKKNKFAMTPSRLAMMDKILEAFLHGEKVMLLGSTGTGKTELAVAIARLVTGKEPITVEVHEGMTVPDLQGRLGIVPVGDHQIKTEIREGPIAQARREGRILILDEKTAGTNRLFVGIKATLNELEKDQKFPGLIATGNLKDERTQDRTDLDPAVLRMYREALRVPYMNEEEHYKLILQELMDGSALLPFPKSELQFLRKLSGAARLMQLCHDGALSKTSLALPEAAQKLISACFADDLSLVHLNKNFLETGTLLSLFKGWSLAREKGTKFPEYLQGKLDDFLSSAKFDMDEDERKLARVLFELSGVLKPDGALDFTAKVGEKSYVLPSELGELFPQVSSGEDKRNSEGGEEGEPDADRDLDDITKLLNIDPGPSLKIEAKIEAQIAEAQELAKLFDIKTGDKAIPRTEKVKKALKNVDAVQWAEIKKFKNPTLLLVPSPTQLKRYESAINRSECKTPCGATTSDVSISDFTKATYKLNDAQDKITGWRFVITEGAPDVTDDGVWNQEKINDVIPKNEERIRLFKEHFTSLGLKGLEEPAYFLLMMKFMKAGLPIDKSTFTLFPEIQRNVAGEGCVAYGDWSATQAFFDRGRLHARNGNTRLRASVMGEIDI